MLTAKVSCYQCGKDGLIDLTCELEPPAGWFIVVENFKTYQHFISDNAIAICCSNECAVKYVKRFTIEQK